MRLDHLKVGKFDVIRDGRRVLLPKAIEDRLAPLPEFIAAVAAAVAAPAERDTLRRWNCELRHIFLAPGKVRCGVVVVMRSQHHSRSTTEAKDIIVGGGSTKESSFDRA
jgi:hypothetical protein